MKQMLKHVKVLVVTRGKDGANLYTNGDEIFIPTVPEREIVDPTGVGDAFRGGFLAGYSRGLDWKLCGEIGSLAAVYCLEAARPAERIRITRQEFVERFRQAFR